MPRIKKLSFLVMILSFGLLCFNATASDLDDGISKATDDNISKWDDLGKADKNINFIILKQKSKAAMAEKRGEVVGSGSGDANMNSVVMGAGSNIRGDIIIIDQSKGDKTNIAD